MSNIKVIKTTSEALLSEWQKIIYDELVRTPSDVQKKAIHAAIAGKNIWVYGGPNTGKSFTLQLVEKGIHGCNPGHKIRIHKDEKYLKSVDLSTDIKVIYYKDYNIVDNNINIPKSITDNFKEKQIIGNSDSDQIPSWVTPENFEIFHLTEIYTY